jgi:hypothetical protein
MQEFIMFVLRYLLGLLLGQLVQVYIVTLYLLVIQFLLHGTVIQLLDVMILVLVWGNIVLLLLVILRVEHLHLLGIVLLIRLEGVMIQELVMDNIVH